MLWAQITTYPWPTTTELKSNKYAIRVRNVNSNGTTGAWLDPYTFNSRPRDYSKDKVGFPASEFLSNGEHNRVGGEAMPSYQIDREMGFTMFSFLGKIEVEVTKLFGTAASRVEVAPKAYGINPHFFDGKVVRFYMNEPNYVSVDFNAADNRDSDGRNGFDIKYSCMIFGEKPESAAGYTIPTTTAPNVVVYSNSTNLATLLAADIIYFPAGDHNLKNHKDNISDWYYTVSQYDNAKLYHGVLKMAKDNQKVYLAPGAYVRGAFHSNGKKNIWLYGRGIISGRSHLMHEIIRPVDGANGIAFVQTTQSKEAFCDMGDGSVINGVVLKEAYHHTCPSGKNTVIKDLKIIGWSYNNDGIRPGSGSTIDHIFIKTCDDYDYARDPHTVTNSVFWPGVNGAVGQLGWNDLGTGFAEYHNNYIINSEWNSEVKDNIGIINGSKAAASIKLDGNVIENLYMEGTVNYLVNAELNGPNSGGYLKNFAFTNISVEKMFQISNGTITKQKMKGYGTAKLSNWTFTNLFVAGVLVTKENHKDYFNLNLDASNNDNANLCQNIIFNSVGPIYTISYKTNAGGTVTPVGLTNKISVAKGMNQMVSINPNAGKKIINVKIDGVSQGRIQNYNFVNVTANHTVEVEFGTGTDYYDLTQTTTPVNQAPSVSLTSPANNASFDAPASITISATANDTDGTVSKVEFYEGNNLIGTDLTSPYSFAWNNVPAGTYSITAKAYDNDAATTSSTALTVTVQTPVVTIDNITDLAAQAKSCTSVKLTWGDVANETGYRIRRKLSTETTFINVADVDANVLTFLDTTVSPSTDYVYTVRPLQNGIAVANSNNASVSTSACIVNQAPTVSVSSPQTSTTNYAPATITLKANATDDNGVTKVEFYRGTTLLGTDNSAPYSYNWTNVAVGNYTITAKAYDADGLVATSSAISITVEALITSVPPSTTIGINGPTCVEVEKAYTFTVNPEKTQVTKITWWSNGGAVVTVDPTNAKNVNVVLPSYLKGTNTTLFSGVNYDVNPWYKEYTTSIKVGGCPTTPTSTLRTEASPQPFDQATVISTLDDEAISTLIVYNIKGLEVDRIENINLSSYELGENLGSGMYIVHVFSQDKVSIVKLIKR